LEIEVISSLAAMAVEFNPTHMIWYFFAWIWLPLPNSSYIAVKTKNVGFAAHTVIRQFGINLGG
jgi:hypothetical protein